MKALTPSETIKFIADCLIIGEIPYIAGPPGIGKSDVFAQVAEDFGLVLIDERLSQKLPEDMSGLPSLNQATGKAQYNPFDTIPMEGDPLPIVDGVEMHGWLLLLDELPSASEEVLAACYSLLLGHTLGGKKVHPKVRIGAAGNRSTDSAIARPLPDTILSRVLPREMRVSAADWLKWAKSLAAMKKKNLAVETVADFIRKNPDMLLSTVDPAAREENESYSTPRGWGKMFKIIGLHEKKSTKTQAKDSAGIPVPGAVHGEPITQRIRNLMEAAVGVIEAKAFSDFYNETMKLPYPHEIVQAPASQPIPPTSAGKASITAQLAEHFADSKDQSRDNILQYINRMDAEYGELFHQMIKEKLGQGATAKRMVEKVGEVLGVTLMPKKIGEDPPSPSTSAADSIFDGF